MHYWIVNFEWRTRDFNRKTADDRSIMAASCAVAVSAFVQLPAANLLMQPRPLRTTVVGSLPLPGWLEFAAQHLDEFGPADLAEMQDDAVTAAIHDQMTAGLDVITDGEQTRLDFNLSFYGYLEGIALEASPPRRFGPPATTTGRHHYRPAGAPGGSRLEVSAAAVARSPGPTLKASLPGPYTLAGRLIPNDIYPDRYAITEALLPLMQQELVRLVEAGCTEFDSG